MPTDNIERAVKKGCGENSGENYEEILYEGYGPAGVAVMCEILTENRNRTAGEVRKVFEVHGGNLGATGCVAWMFERKAAFSVSPQITTEDRLFEIALDAGADDVSSGGECFEVVGPPERFQAIAAALEAAGIATESAEISRVPQNTVDLDAESARRVLKLLDALEDNDDVQNVTANFNLPDDVMQEVLAES